MRTRWRRAKDVIDTTKQLSRKGDEKFDPERKDATDEPPDNVSSGTTQGYGVQPAGPSYGGNPNPGANSYGNFVIPTSNIVSFSEPSESSYQQSNPSHWQPQSPYSHETYNQQSVYPPQQHYFQPPSSSWPTSHPSLESRHPNTHQNHSSTFGSNPGSSPPQVPMSSPISQYSGFSNTGSSFTTLPKSPERSLTQYDKPFESPKLAPRTWTVPFAYTESSRCALHGGGYKYCDESQCDVCNNL